MNLLDTVMERARAQRARVGIGIGVGSDVISESMLADLMSAHEFADLVLIGGSEEMRAIETDTGTDADADTLDSFEIIHSDDPEQELVRKLVCGEIDAAVRGMLSATKTLKNLRSALGIPKLHRLALLATTDNQPFFLAPVGIDEGNTIADKIDLVQRGASYITRFGITPKVAVLSGGRFEDVGRSAIVDQSLADGEVVARKLSESGIDAKHYGILIEAAVRDANFVVAPDGIAGNLIFRTLTFLGGGVGFGAPVLVEPIFVDTSRVKVDYSNAIMLASALTWGACNDI
ncbi:MAG: methanogenesis marker protein Mmp4/MtxX [Methanosarcinales archaeon]|nr:methanogenesis marker protein Mmp4/MtxX [Methanosarcinales archaeon]